MADLPQKVAFPLVFIMRISAAGLMISAILISAALSSERVVGSGRAIKTDSKLHTHLSDVCSRIESAAGMWSIPPGFLARLIWQESRFDPNAVSPKGAMGIAQFMPDTARFRRLENPFNHKTAIPASAHYLSDLRNTFGSIGLAAAAYNAGPDRVTRWLHNKSFLPYETENFVSIITGISAETWKSKKKQNVKFALNEKLPFYEACIKFPIKAFRIVAAHGTARRQPWGVQITADWSRQGALRLYTRVKRRYPNLFGETMPMILRVRNLSFGTAYRYDARVGKSSQKSALTFCRKLTQAGVSCAVLKTRR